MNTKQKLGIHEDKTGRVANFIRGGDIAPLGHSHLWRPYGKCRFACIFTDNVEMYYL